ncbi:MAG: glycoside hydrolase family 3 C-terminal domain-containing protein [Bacilli bacterium]
MSKAIRELLAVLTAFSLPAFSNTECPLSSLINPTKKISGAIVSNREIASDIANEGIVLLKNDYSVLPFTSEDRILGVGKGMTYTYMGGKGSGEVNNSLTVNYDVGLKKALSNKLIESYKNAAVDTVGDYNKAIYVVSRITTEGADNSESKYYYLSDTEKQDIATLISNYGNENVVIVLNTGGVIDTSWLIEEDVGAIVCAYYAGYASGFALANVLTGQTNPSGKTVDTWAKSYEDYPSSSNFGSGNHIIEYSEDIFVGYRYFSTFDPTYAEVCYPFGYGLSYTTFEMSAENITQAGNQIDVSIKVTNTGKVAGKEVAQLYLSEPQGRLGKEAMNLVGFAKSDLLSPNQSQILNVSFDLDDFASFDDTGAISNHCYVLEKGTYNLFLGSSVKEAQNSSSVYSYNLAEDEVKEASIADLSPTALSSRLKADGEYESLSYEPHNDDKKEAKILGRHEEKEAASEDTITFKEVYENNDLIDDFLNQLSNEDLANLCQLTTDIGSSSTSVGGFGGKNINSIYGIPNIGCSDGPAGLRLTDGTTSTWYPCMTMLSSTWNEELAYQYGQAVGAEAKKDGIQMWLAPAINIHRNPLGGRNFEYASEDPLISGKFSSNIINGCQSLGVAVCLKHFAVNSQETNRFSYDAQVSERALREVYLKGFEIAVKEAHPYSIMTSYNQANGKYVSSNYQFVSSLLRDEWGFNGVCITDWNASSSQVDNLLAGTSVQSLSGNVQKVLTALNNGSLSKERLLWNAKQVINILLKVNDQMDTLIFSPKEIAKDDILINSLSKNQSFYSYTDSNNAYVQCFNISFTDDATYSLNLPENMTDCSFTFDGLDCLPSNGVITLKGTKGIHKLKLTFKNGETEYDSLNAVYQEEKDETTPEKTSNIGLILGITISLCVLLGFGGFLLIKRNKKSKRLH